MNSKRRRQVPLEVSTWMDKDLTLRKVSANSRLLTNDTRQNIVLSRHFFSNLLTLSFERYRKMAQLDFDKKRFIQTQQHKSETSMPGLHQFVDHLDSGMSRPATSRMQSSRRGDKPFISPSSQSFFSHAGTHSDLRFDRRHPPSTRKIKTAEIRKSRPEIITAEHPPTTPANRRSPTGRQMSRETLNRLSRPKGYRHQSEPGDPFVRSNVTEGTETVEEVLAQIDEATQITATSNLLPEKRKTAADDVRFHQLMGSFSVVYVPKTSNLKTFRNIVQENPSLQDNEGQWKSAHPSSSSRKAQREHHRQILADKLRQRVDIFLVDVRA